MFKWFDGKMYIGNWEDGRMHGEGTYLALDGSIYNGEYKHDYRTGEGAIIYSTGHGWSGEWNKGKQDGTGFQFQFNSNEQSNNPLGLHIRKGIWDNGRVTRWIEWMTVEETDKY